MNQLTLEKLIEEAKEFCKTYKVPYLLHPRSLGIKTEKAFIGFLKDKYLFKSAGDSGIDLPELNVDIKTVGINNLLSSCKFTSSDQRKDGLGFHIILFIYDLKKDGKIESYFIDKKNTSDYRENKHGVLSIYQDNQWHLKYDLKKIISLTGKCGREV